MACVFSEAVTYYYKKLRRSGAPWTPEGAAEDAGVKLAVMKKWWEWCDSHTGLNDEQLIALWKKDGLNEKLTPFGVTFQPKNLVGRRLGDLTVEELNDVLDDKFRQYILPQQG